MHVYDGGSTRHGVRILIADDDPLIRSLVAANLAGRAVTVTEAADGQEAWSLLLETTFDIALIDLSMPGIDGFTLIRCMRAHPRTKHMPIIVITSNSDRDAVSHAFEAGATSFLTKPVNWALFGHHIDYLIRTHRGVSSARAGRQQAEAVARAKDAVIAALAARVRDRTARIIGEAESELDSATIAGSGQERLEFVARVLDQALAVEDMLDDVLAHLQTMTEDIVVDDRATPVPRLLRAGIERLGHLAETRQVSITQADCPEELTVLCDEGALLCALSNLLRNAIEHTPPGGRVEVGAERRSDNVLAIMVDDEGPGADLAAVADCLSPLGGRRSAVGKHAPATLGLPMAKAIAQAHGGTIEVMLRPEAGTRASIILPADIVEDEQERAA
jgi:CheY-like chemotaxis protein